MKRALLVGISKYLPNPAGPRPINDLAGPGNDVLTIRALLQARYGFRDEEIRELLDAQATREGILSAIHAVLIQPTQPGDVVFFYFAGHGSTVDNPLSQEPDQQDEALVPADAALGVADLHDKELGQLFNQVLDQGGVLTAIFDSCFSGSITLRAGALPRADRRGQASTAAGVRARYAIPSRTAARPLAPLLQAPEERGALILSAAQDFQSALERPLGGLVRGVFTTALVKVLAAAPADEPILSAFNRASSLVRAYTGAQVQVPVIAGLPARRAQTFLGQVAVSRGLVVVAGPLTPAGLTLHAGHGLGLGPGAELTHVDDPGLRLRVHQVLDLGTSVAQVIAGDASQARAGAGFQVRSFGGTGSTQLRVALGPAGPTEEALRTAVAEVVRLRDALSERWVSDPMAVAPSHEVCWEGEGWCLFRSTSAASAPLLPPQPQLCAQDILLVLAQHPQPRLYVNLPLAQEAHARLVALLTGSDLVALVRAAEGADYRVLGQVGEDAKPVYALALPRPPQELAPMPARLAWDSFAALPGQAARLQRQRLWLTLDAPAQGQEDFPFRMVLVRDDGATLTPGGQTRSGERYHLRLHWQGPPLRFVEGRYIYLFVMSSHGELAVLFPVLGNVQNYLPREAYPVPMVEVLDSQFETEGGASVDTYVMLTSREEIADPWGLFSLDSHLGVGADPAVLEALLSSLPDGEPATASLAARRWTLERLQVRHSP